MRRFSAFLVALITFWLAASAPAHAGPLLTAVGALVVNLGAVGNAIVGLVVNFGFQTLMTAFFGPKEPKDKGTKQRMENGADKAPKIILGQYGTPGHLLYHNSFLENRKVYVQVIILSAIPVKGVSNYCRIAGQNCTIDFGTVDDDGFSPVSEYQQYGNNYAKVKVHLGGQTVADPFLVDNFGSDPDFPWASDMIVKGCAYVIVQSLYSKKGVWAGTPEYFFKVDGIPLYDPRRDSSVGGSGSQRWNDMSTWGGSGDYNPKVQIYNIIRGIRDIDGSRLWGGRAEAYRLPLDYWFAAMNVCDQDIEKKNGDIVKRYQTGLEIELDSEPLDIIMDLDKSCSGFTTEYGGKYKTWCGEPGLSVMTVTDDDFYISDPMKDDPFKPVQETYNSAVATYPEPRSGWSMEPGPLYVDAEYLAADDNEPLVLDAQLPYVTENNQVQRLMREAIRESRIQLSHTGTLPPEAYILEPHDRISYISTRNGYHGDGVDFLIGSKEDYPDVRQVVTIRGVNPNAFGWLKEMELDHTVGHMGVVRHNALDVAFSVAPDWTETENGRDKPAIAVTWDWGDIDVDVDRVKWEVRKASTGKKIAEGAIHKLEDGHALLVHPAFRFKQQLEIRFYAQPISKRDSDWTVWLPITLVDLSAPSAPTLTAQSFLAGDGTLDYYLKIDWPSVAGEVSYKVEITEITDGSAVRVHPAETSHFKLRVTSGGQFSVRIATKAADGGTQSDWSNPTTITINPKTTAPAAPTGLTLVASFKTLVLSWPRQTEKDYGATRVYEATVNDFTLATIVHEKAGTGWTRGGLPVLATRYYWITHLDRHGNESPKYPASNTAGINGTTTAIADTDTDGTAPATPTGLAVTPRTNLNGDGKVDVELVITWTGIANKKASYVLRVEDVAAGTFDYHEIKDIGSGSATAHRKVIRAISSTAYNISVAAVSGSGTVGSYTANVNVTATKKTLLPTAPTSLVAIGKHGRIVLKSNRSPDSDYRRTNIFASNTNDFTTATKIDMVNSTKFDESDLGNLVTRFYWITFEDRTGNESNKYPASNTAGVTATTVTVGDLDTDSAAPNAPTGVTLTQRTNIDEDGKAVLDLKVTWTAPFGATARTSYEVNVSDGTDSWNVKATDLNARVPVRSNLLYTVKVRALTFNGTPGGYSSPATITPSKKATAPTTASGLTANANHKRVKLTWTACADADYKQTRIYRNTVNTFGTATIIGHIKGTTYPDDDLTSNTTYFYWVAHIDQSGNVGTASASATDTTPYILDADTDPTALGAPTGLALAQAAKDVDEDGKVDIAITVTWSALTGAKSYELEITEAGTIIDNAKATAAKKTFKAKSNKLYSVRIRALSFNGTPGAWSSAVTLTPSKKSAAVAAPSSLSVAGGSKRNKLSWSVSAEADYKFTRIYRSPNTTWASATVLDHVKGTAFVDDNLAGGTSYYYYVAHVDTSGNESSVFPASSGAGVVGIPGTLTTADLAAGSVTDAITDQTAPATPSPPSVAQTNRDLNGDGAIDMGLKLSVAALPSGAKSIVFRIDEYQSDGTTLIDTWYEYPKKLVKRFGPVIAGHVYKVSAAGVSFNQVEGSFSSVTSFTPAKKSSTLSAPSGFAITPKPKGLRGAWTQPADTDIKRYEWYVNTANSQTGGTLVKAGNGDDFLYAAELTVGTAYYVFIRSVDRSDLVSGWVAASNNPQTYRGLKSTDSNTNDPAAMCENNDFSLGPNIGWSVPADIVSDAVNAFRGIYVMKKAYAGVTINYTNRNQLLFPVRAGEQYYIGGMLKTDASFAASAGLGYRLSLCTDQAGGSEVATLPIYFIQTPQTAWAEYGGVVTIPATSTIAYARLEPTVIGMTAGTVYWSHMFCRPEASKLVKTDGITDDKADSTPPGTPGVPSLQQIAADIDGDGTIDIALQVTLTLPGSGVPVKYYEVELQRSSTVGGTYAAFGPRIHVPAESSGSTLYQFKANANKFYKARARAVSFSGAKGAYSALTADGRQPLNYTTTIAASAPTAVLTPKGITVKWPAITNANYAYTIVTRSPGGEVARVCANHFTDVGIAVALSVNTAYTYTIQHVTASGAVSAASSASNSVTFDLINPGDLRQQPDGNFFRNPGLADGVGDGWSFPAVVTVVPRASATVADAPSEYVFKITADGNWNGPTAGGYNTADWFEVSPGEVFAARFWAAADAITGTGNVFIAVGYRNASGDGITSYTTVAADVPTLDTAGTWQEFKGLMTAPATVNGLPTAKMFIYVQINNTLTAGSVYVAKPRLRRATDRDMLTLGAVLDAHTDSTVPSTPSSLNLTLSQVQRRDKDGGIKTYLKGVFNTAGYTSKQRFMFTISDGTNSNEKYSKTGKFLFPAEVGLTYGVTVQAYTFVDMPSAASSVVNKLITAKTADMGTPTGLGINSSHKRNEVYWNAVDTDAYPDYATTVIYRNTVNTAPTPGVTAHYRTNKGNSIVDAAIDTSTLYYYWIAHRDATGNFTSVAGPVSGTGQRVPKGDVDTVTTPSAPSPGSLTVSQGAKDVDAGDGRVSVKVVMTASALPTNADEIQFEVDFNYPSTPEIHTFPASKGLKASFDGIVGKTYLVNYRGISVFDVLGPALASGVTITPVKNNTPPADPTSVSVNSNILGMEVRWAQPTETDYDYTQVALRTSIGTPLSTEIVAISKSITVRFPWYSTGLWYIYVRHINRSGNASNWVPYAPGGTPSAAGVQKITASFIDDNVVTKLATMGLGDVGSLATLKNNSASTIAAGSTTASTNLVYSDSAGTAGASPPAGSTWMALGTVAATKTALFVRVS